MAATSQSISIEGAATNNLKGLDVAIPVNKLSVVTGVSGSGKSSLVFDTLYGEAYRRYVESLSSFARQYLKALPKPDIKQVKNLPPAIAVKQSRSGGNSRSTVGTMTEVADLLRIVFTHMSVIVCPDCELPVEKDNGETIAKKVLEQFTGQQVMVAAPLVGWGKVPAKALKAQLAQQGFVRACVGDKVVKLAEARAADLKNGAVIVDRIRVDQDHYQRLVEAAELGLKVGRKKVRMIGTQTTQEYVAYLGCGGCGQEFVEPTLALFSFNHPYGACPHCQGFGMEGAVDWRKVIPDQDASLEDEGIAVFNFGRKAHIYKLARSSAKAHKIRLNKPFREFTAKEWQWLQEGDGKSFVGVDGFFAWLSSKRHKAHYRIHVARFRKYVTCTSCHGARLNEHALACRILDRNFAQVAATSIREFAHWLTEVQQLWESLWKQVKKDGSGQHVIGVREAIEELVARTGYLQKIGLGYLTLDRQTRTLSGGEQQRINMARCLGSALTDTMYCLDEPTAGLHARDSENLLGVLYELRDQGNTVVVVEHERTVIDGADHLVEIGPKAGHQGGELTFAGDPCTHQEQRVSWPRSQRRQPKHWVKLEGASTHNLKNIDIKIPVGRVTAVCGVSGSGKTSLIQHTLYPLMARHYGNGVDGNVEEPIAKKIGPSAALAQHELVVHVSQASLGRSSRSNIATYLGLFDEIRKMLARTHEAKHLGLTPSHFSFNTKGGRCESCRGLGTVVEDLSFLGDMEVICPSCEGRRFSDAVLSVRVNRLNLSEILKLTVAEAREVFFDRKALVKVLDYILDMGLGYVALGQNTSSFSGGEAQRLKLLRLLKTAGKSKPAFLIFDEPTTGLSDTDVLNLVAQLNRLADLGHTVVVVEHHLGVLRSADWLIEIGPDAAELGGEVVYQGSPQQLRGVKSSQTERFLH